MISRNGYNKEDIEAALNILRDAGLVIRVIAEDLQCRLVVDEVRFSTNKEGKQTLCLRSDGRVVPLPDKFRVRHIAFRGEYPEIILESIVPARITYTPRITTVKNKGGGHKKCTGNITETG